MPQSFRNRIEQLARARYGTTDAQEALQRLRADWGIPRVRQDAILAGVKGEEGEYERLAIALRVDREDIDAPPNKLETKRRFLDYLDRIGEGHRKGELLPKLMNGVRYRTEDHDLEKPLDDRHFGKFMAEQGLTDYGEWQLELGL
ncbi:MAG: hypothetical protein HW388_1746 [Dehalococcoidia bacterium]|nr:hypothetical protein [Dehalococcoidia bacterium]